MKKQVIYNADVSHCPGAGRRICTRCYRLRLLKMWDEIPSGEREPVILFPPKAEGCGCKVFLNVENY